LAAAPRAAAVQPGLGVPPPPAYFNRNLLAQPRVPDLPANVALAIDSDKSLLITFDVPPSDFGSQVTSYKVEWDSNPGVREEQVVTCTVATGPNEVQRLTTTATRVPEVQVVSVTTTNVAPGSRITGNFTLGFGGQVTKNLSRSATEDEVRAWAVWGFPRPLLFFLCWGGFFSP
jgi:hypothetical protein